MFHGAMPLLMAKFSCFEENHNRRREDDTDLSNRSDRFEIDSKKRQNVWNSK